jgi:predicted amidophosphoribosyltransferase
LRLSERITLVTHTVDCPSCGHENRPVARFCESCGAPLPQLRIGDRLDALQNARKAVAIATEQGIAVLLPISYRVLAEALLADEDANEALAASRIIGR